MARAKKDGEKISLYLDRVTMERMRAFAVAKGQTLTVAIEWALKSYLNEHDDVVADENILNGIK